MLDTCTLLQPAQFFVKKRSSEKSVLVSVLDAKSCGAETVPELVTLYLVPLSSLSLPKILTKGTLSARTGKERSLLEKGGDPQKEKRVHTRKEGVPQEGHRG